MLRFSLPGIIAIGLMIIMTVLAVYVLIRRIRKYTLHEKDDDLKKFGVLLAVLGGLSIILSVALVFLVYFDFQGKSRLLHPFQVLVTEPARLFIIALFLLGMLASAIGGFTAKRFSESGRHIPPDTGDSIFRKSS